jgi:hypothetical protein
MLKSAGRKLHGCMRRRVQSDPTTLTRLLFARARATERTTQEIISQPICGRQASRNKAANATFRIPSGLY